MFCLDTWPPTVVSVADMTTALGARTLHEWDWTGFVCVVRDYLAADDNISWVLMDSAAVLADTAQLLTNPRWTLNRAEGRSHVTSQMSNNRAMRNSCYTGTGAERLDASKTPVQSAGLQMLGWMRGRHIEQNAFIPSSSIHIYTIQTPLHLHQTNTAPANLPAAAQRRQIWGVSVGYGPQLCRHWEGRILTVVLKVYFLRP